jgi:hypothetical protein
MYHRASDRRIGETSKLELAWGSFRRNIQRSFLFIMVICYFPAAAAILAAFSDRYDSAVLAAYGYACVNMS